MTGQLLETALKAVATTVLPSGYAVTTGLDDAAKTSKRVIVQALPGSSKSPQPGNMRHKCRVIVESNPSDTTEAQHGTNARAVFEGFITTTLAAELTAGASNFTCLHVFRSFDTRDEISRRLFRSELEFEVICCASNVS